MLTVDLTEAAGRTAYLAGFHAAQALIFEVHQRVFKTHSGVRGELRPATSWRGQSRIGLRRDRSFLWTSATADV